MITYADYKVPGGKLIRIKSKVLEGRIASVKITGDFFVHPEDGIIRLETALIGKKLENVTLQKTVEKALAGCEVIGFWADDMVVALLKLNQKI